MKSRLATFTVVVAAAVLLLGGVCGRRLYPPEFTEVPSSVHAGDLAVVKLIAGGRGYDSVRYVVNWDDAAVDTSEPYSLNDVATMWHVWTETGTRQVRAAVFSLDDPQGIRWAAQRSVDVEAGGAYAPTVDSVLAPPVAVKDVRYYMRVFVHDPDGDSVRLRIAWDTTETTTTPYFVNPWNGTVSHVFTQTETATVVLSAQDKNGAVSPPDTVQVHVGTEGGVRWYRAGACWTSPLVVSEQGQEFLYCSMSEDPEDPEGEPTFRATSTAGQGGYIYEGGYALTDEPAFCITTGHIIIGAYEGALVALSLRLGQAWDWLSEWWRRWGPMAIRGSRIYVLAECDGDDSMYYFIDSIAGGVRAGAFVAGVRPAGAPAVDAHGDVYLGTDSGYLYKVGPGLDTPLWRIRLVTNGKIHSPIVGDDGTVYCSSESSHVYAIDPMTGVLLWTASTEGRPLRLAMGRSAIFFGTDLGHVYSISPATGSVNWEVSLVQDSGGFHTTPIVAATGYLYIQDDNDVIYCLSQADGAKNWACDCNSYLPGGKRRSHRTSRPGLFDHSPNPTITSSGDIIVPGQSALFCVAGNPEGSLDRLAPWPKWQHDLYNTGYVGGGR